MYTLQSVRALGIVAIAAIWITSVNSATLVLASDVIEFNRDIRPILADNCFSCHGPDNKTRQADLRLDTAEGLHAAGVMVSGKPEDSGLYQRIISTDDSQKMPPADSHKQLTADQVDLLKRWIEQGGEYQSHWSYLPIRQPTEESVQASEASRVIDYWIDRQLQKQQLAPSSRADRVTLLRRLHFDFRGRRR